MKLWRMSETVDIYVPHPGRYEWWGGREGELLETDFLAIASAVGEVPAFRSSLAIVAASIQKNYFLNLKKYLSILFVGYRIILPEMKRDFVIVLWDILIKI